QDQIAVVYAATHGYMDDLPATAVADFGSRFLQYLKSNREEILKEIKEKKALSDELLKKLDEACQAFKKTFTAGSK
ncbi:MAG: F0F1 ATP synthase subunit alpha, partial [Candidatus Xenobia bacterium]